MGSPIIPSDDSGAVGRHHYVQVVNTSLAVFDRKGNPLAGPISTTTFWSNQPDCGGQLFTDSVVIYDRHADRWVISRPGGPMGADLCLAISQTSDPAGPYDQYAFEVNNQANGLAAFFNDYPKIGAWPKAVAEIGGHAEIDDQAEFDDQQDGEHQSGGGSYLATADPNKIFCGLGNTISAFDRAAMLAGDSAPAFVAFFVPGPVPGSITPDCNPGPSIPRTHMLPADLDGKKLPPADAPGYIVQVQDEHLGFPAGRLQVYEFAVDWTNPSLATLTPTTSLIPEPFDSNEVVGRRPASNRLAEE